MIIRDDTSKQKTKQQLITECSNSSSVLLMAVLARSKFEEGLNGK